MDIIQVDSNHEHVRYLLDSYKSKTISMYSVRPITEQHGVPSNYTVVDLLGTPLEELFKLNDPRPIYLWFESVFLIPDDIAGAFMMMYGAEDGDYVTRGPL